MRKMFIPEKSKFYRRKCLHFRHGEKSDVKLAREARYSGIWSDVLGDISPPKLVSRQEIAFLPGATIIL
jgi:hypothetical protein